MLHMDDFKKVASSFIETEVVPKSPYSKKAGYVALSIVLPKIIDKFVSDKKDFMQLAGIMDESEMIDVDVTENFGVELLTRLGGYEIMGIKFEAIDVHNLALMARRYE